VSNSRDLQDAIAEYQLRFMEPAPIFHIDAGTQEELAAALRDAVTSGVPIDTDTPADIDI
jgi:hypothetical protein